MGALWFLLVGYRIRVDFSPVWLVFLTLFIPYSERSACPIRSEQMYTGVRTHRRLLIGYTEKVSPRLRQAAVLGAAHALRFAASVAPLSGYYLSLRKCKLVSPRELRYLGIIWDSQHAAFRVPREKLVKVCSLILDVLHTQRVATPTLEKIVGKCSSMRVAVQPAPLWTHVVYGALFRFHFLPRMAHRPHFGVVPHSDLPEELGRWVALASTPWEGPWYKAQHFYACINQAASDTSAHGWGGLITVHGANFRAGSDIFRPNG